MSEVAKKILESARDLIKTPEAWIQGQFAADKDGNATIPEVPDAVCFCSYGAIRKVAYDNKFSMTDHALATSSLDLVMWGIVDYNDTHTHEEVLSKFDEAIKSLEE